MKEEQKNQSGQGRRRFLKVTSIVAGACLAPSTVSAASSETVDPSNINTSFNPEKTKQTYQFANNLSAIESEKTQNRIYDSLTATQQSAVNQALQVDKVTVETETDASIRAVGIPITARHSVRAKTTSGGTAYKYTNVSEWNINNGYVSNISVSADHTAPAFGWNFDRTIKANVPRMKQTYFYSNVKGHFTYITGDEAYPHVKVVGDGQGSSRVLSASPG